MLGYIVAFLIVQVIGFDFLHPSRKYLNQKQALYVVHALILATQETEVSGCLCVLGQPSLYDEVSGIQPGYLVRPC